MKIGDVVTLYKKGVSIEKNNPTSNKSTYRYLRCSEVDNGLISGSDVSYIKDITDDLKPFICNKGDLLISRFGSVNYSYVVEEDNYIVPNPHFYIFRFDTTKVDTYYMASVLIKELGKIKPVGGRNIVIRHFSDINTINNMDIELPSIEDQKRLGEVYQEHLNRIKELTNELNKEKEKLTSF